jgi:glycosyltransferase involved in cell wall biosynthesis
MPVVSVVIPCYNSALFIEETLGSLRAQSFRDWECIVVDDGSTDESASIVRTCGAEDSRIRLVQQSNAGVSRARNRGYSLSSRTSRYLLFLDSDDCLGQGMLEELIQYLDERPNVCLAYCAFTCVGEAGEIIRDGDSRLPDCAPSRLIPSRFGIKRIPATEPETPFTSIFAGWAGLLPSNSLLRRSVYATAPGWDEAFGQPAEDTDMFLHMALRGSVHYIPHSLVRYRRYSNQSTADGARLIAQNKKLFMKWSRHQDLTARQLAEVRAARSFRFTRLEPSWWLAFAVAHLRNGSLIEGAKCTLRAGRQYAIGRRTLNSAALM